MFYPGETDYQTFTLPFPASDVASVLVTYKQKGKVILEKETTGYPEAVDVEECRVSLSLNQEETLKFNNHDDIAIQLNVYGTEGGRVTSNPIILRCGEQFHRQVI